MNPVAPPELHMLEDSSTAGVYSINLTQAMPDYSDRSEDGPTGMIFRLQDLQSGNVTYIQLVHFVHHCMHLLPFSTPLLPV